MSLGAEETHHGSLKPHDSLFRDAEKVSHSTHRGSQVSWMQTLSLAFQSIGIIYGDIGTSPLYVYSSTFPDGIKNNDDLLGVLSLILYTLILIPMFNCLRLFVEQHSCIDAAFNTSAFSEHCLTEKSEGWPDKHARVEQDAEP